VAVDPARPDHKSIRTRDEVRIDYLPYFFNIEEPDIPHHYYLVINPSDVSQECATT